MLIAIHFQRRQYSCKIVNLLLMAVLMFPLSAFSHGGGLDSSGCHHDRKRGGYHCHRSSYTPPVTPSYNNLYSSPQAGGNSYNGFKSNNNTSSYLTGSIPAINAATTTNTGQSERVANLEKLLFEQTNKIRELESTIAYLKNKEATGVQNCKETDKKNISTTESEAKKIFPNIEPMPSSNEKYKVRVKTIQSNVRRQPVFEDNVIGTVDKGDILSVISEDAKFYLVNTSSGEAYIHKTTVESLNLDTPSNNSIDQKSSATYDPLQGISYNDKAIIEIACVGKWTNGIGEYKNCLQEQRKQLDNFNKQN